MRQSLYNLLKVVVTVGLFAVLIYTMNPANLVTVLVNVQLLPLLLALALYSIALVLGALKWQALVRAQGIEASLGDLLSFALVGLFFGNFMPSNVGGDVVRAYDLARVTHGRTEAAAISVLVDRLMGFLANLGSAVIMAVVTAVLLVQELAQYRQVALYFEIVTIAVAVVFVCALALLFSRRASRRAAFLFELPPLARVRPLALKVYHALQVYRFHYRALALNVSLSVAIVILTAVAWYTLGLSVGITNVSFLYFLLFNPLIAFVTLIPISLNGLGVKEAGAVYFFKLMGVPAAEAFSMSLLFHVIIIATSLPGGLLWLRTRNLAPADSQVVASSDSQMVE